MRITYLALRLLAAGCCIGVTNGCAEGGLPDDALNDNSPGDDEEDAGTTSNSKDAGKDARAATLDATTGTPAKEDSGTTTGGNKDSGTTTGGGSKDSGTATSTGPGAAIKCPSPMVCDTSLASILSIVDTSIKSTDTLCVTPGGILPASVSCTTVDTCKSSRLTTATCTGGSCIQPCTP